MRLIGLTVFLMLALAASADARLKRSAAQRYAESRLAYLVPLYANPTPQYKLRRCSRVSPQRFACPFKVVYMTGQPYRGVLEVVKHRRVVAGMTRLGFRLPPIPYPPKRSLRRSLADYG